MPTFITHQLLAEEVYKALPQSVYSKIGSLPHYYLGAQGCDVCFAYKPVSTLKNNFGSFLHAFRPELFFRLLQEEAEKDPFVRSYAYGYLTHYAADTVFHPYIYKEMGEDNGFFRHHSIEHAYDGYLLKRYRGKGAGAYSLPPLKDLPLDGVFLVYKRYAEMSGWGTLRRTAFFKAVNRYLCLCSVRMPFYRKEQAKDAEELFDEAKKRSLLLAEKFTEKGQDKELFGKHYLSGKVEKPKKIENPEK
jgi:hypothetical protein